MAAIVKFYGRFNFVILHQPVKFHNNQTVGGRVMTSYRFFKMAAIELEIYFRVQV